MTNRRALFVLLAGALLAASFVSRSQTAGKSARIGFLGNSLKGPLGGDLTAEFVKAMRALGWSQGQNISFDYRWSEQRNERFPDLARELVALNVDLIVVTAGVTAALAAKRVTATTPILLVGGADPVKFGLVASFGHPGGNVTGLMQPLVDWGKWAAYRPSIGFAGDSEHAAEGLQNDVITFAVTHRSHTAEA